VVIAANFVAVAARMSLVQFLGIYFVHRAGIDVTTVGLAFLAENLARGLLAPLFGALSDRVGRRVLLIGSSALTAAILPAFLLVDAPAPLFAWSLALGTVGAINIPVSSALLLDLAPAERRQSVLALNYAAMSVAYTLGVVPAGYVAQHSYALLAAMSAAGYVAVALLYFLVLRGGLPLERGGSEAGVIANTLGTFTDRRFVLFATLAFVFPLSMGMLISVSPLYGASLGLGEGYIGLVLGGNSVLVAALALPVASRIEARGPFRWLGAAAGIVAVSLALYGVVPDPASAFLAGTVLYSFGEVVFSSAVPAAVARLAPAGRRGAYQGGWALVSSFSLGSALFLSGLVAKVAGWQAAWLAAAGLTLLAAVLLLLLRRRFQNT